MKVYSAAIYLKSGAVVRGRFKKLVFTRNDDGVGYNKVEWETFGFPKFMTLQVSDVSVVTVEAEEDVDE